MNVRKWSLVVIMSALCAAADASAQPLVVPETETPAGAQESAAVQTIRLRVAESCFRNPECARRTASGVRNAKSGTEIDAPSDTPSTPDRRRALGLVEGPIWPQ